ncbi:FCD domain-containing protein [Streptomyces sp. NBC_00075]|uniref:FadR/GntR family transcriptional regulator n=1 Tax=Streptomyces sp. NBC_00075 TaxID=2975641 RepID=UPI00324EDBE5
MDFRFEPVSALGGRAPEAVANQIVLAIRAGAYRAGEHLPPARELARRFGVSQGTVSSAIKVLGTYGLVKPARGNQGGIRVTRDDIPADLLQLLSRRSDDWRAHAYAELVQARRAIELPLAVLAAENASPADLAHMVACLDEMTVAHENHDMDAWITSDLRFHYSLGHAARSSVLARYQHEVLIELALLVDMTEDFQNSGLVVRIHHELLAAMRTGDGAAVRDVMEQLIERTECP